MPVQFSVANQQALGRIKGLLTTIADPTPHIPSLMLPWQQVIREDNLRGVLAGLDRYGQPLAPVTYRPVDDVAKRINIRAKSSARLRLGQHASRKRDLLFGGIGPASSGLHNNLSSSEYRRLDGPPIAPRQQFSRVISNLLTDWLQEGPQKWVAFGYWDEVVSPSGFHFLPVHFEGKPLGKHGPSIQRDLRGVRPEGMERAREVLRAWAHDLLISYDRLGVSTLVA